MLTLTRKDLLKRTGLPEINITNVTILIKEHLKLCHILEIRDILRGTQESLRVAAVKVLTLKLRKLQKVTMIILSLVTPQPHRTHPVQALASVCHPCWLSMLSLWLSLLVPASVHSPSLYFSFIHLLFLPPISIILSSYLLPSLSSWRQAGDCPLTAKVERHQG